MDRLKRATLISCLVCPLFKSANAAPLELHFAKKLPSIVLQSPESCVLRLRTLSLMLVSYTISIWHPENIRYVCGQTQGDCGLVQLDLVDDLSDLALFERPG